MKSKRGNETIDGIYIFACNLRELRQERGQTQEQVARMLGVGVSTYANWEQGRREPSIGDIYAILRIWDISADELFDKE